MTFPFASLTAWLALAAYAGLSWHFLAHAHGWSIPWRRALHIEHLLVAAALALHFWRCCPPTPMAWRLAWARACPR